MTNRRPNTSNRARPRVFGTGLIALDLVVSRHEEGRTQHFAGGTCGNVLTILSFLGWDAYPISRLNGDFTSRWVREDLARWGVHNDYLSLEPTGPVPVIIEWINEDERGRRSHRYSFVCPTCGSRKPAYRPVLASTVRALLQGMPAPEVFFFDRVSPAAVLLANEFRSKGSVVFFEPSGVGQPKLFARALSLAHVVKYATDRLGTTIDDYRRDQVALEIETFGARGLRFRSRLAGCKTRGWRQLDSIPVPLCRDAAGSGDWLTATLLDRIGRGGARGLGHAATRSLLEALQFAQGAAAWNCSFEAPRGGMYGIRPDQFPQEVGEVLEGRVPRHHDDSIVAANGKSSPDCACLHCQVG